jgi:uncharacterized short protein YbdD (DUF466 family)
MITPPMKSASPKGEATHETRGVLFKRSAKRLWLGIREWCGDSAYDRYVQAHRAGAENSAPLTPAEFYVEQLNRRYSRPSRCC